MCKGHRKLAASVSSRRDAHPIHANIIVIIKAAQGIRLGCVETKLLIAKSKVIDNESENKGKKEGKDIPRRVNL